MKLIVAYQQSNFGIGYKGKIPWNIPQDMKLFKAITMGHTVVMGRKTWESLPAKYKPLPGRKNLILTTGNVDNALTRGQIPGAKCIKDLREAPEDAVIIGGSQVYKLALEMDLVDSLICSLIKTDYDVDVFFPKLKGDWSFDRILNFPEFEVVLFRKST